MRHIRQIALQEIGKKGQEQLRQSFATIVGIGALGTVVAELLCRAGIGKLLLIDRDLVEISNLQRQSLFNQNDLGKPKAESAEKHLKLIDDSIITASHNLNLTGENINIIKSDIVLDCTDNLETKMLLNEYCIKNNIPLVHGSALGTKGFVFVSTKNACLNCIYSSKKSEMSCESGGVLNTITHLVASLQANEAVKILTGKMPEESLIMADIWNNEFEKIKVRRNINCEVCNGIYELLEAQKMNEKSKEQGIENLELTIKPCKTESAMRVIPKPNISINFNKLKNNFKTIAEAQNLIVLEKEGEIIVFRHGELLFKDLKDIHKIESIAREIYISGV
ncbi:MAG TPA: HesA/MoeB/ThiF family protein [Candidatus Nanoarchaeia archaeon]|nr:HesA/MoeB/ThiF family protein [Candidatus Nanoarchaeia archaeon]